MAACFSQHKRPDGDVNLPAKRIRVLLKINKARKCSELSLMDPVVSLEHMLKSFVKNIHLSLHLCPNIHT